MKKKKREVRPQLYGHKGVSNYCQAKGVRTIQRELIKIEMKYEFMGYHFNVHKEGNMWVVSESISGLASSYTETTRTTLHSTIEKAIKQSNGNTEEFIRRNSVEDMVVLRDKFYFNLISNNKSSYISLKLKNILK